MKICIFRYFQKQIFGISHDFNHSDQDSLGLNDSPYTHFEYWETLRNIIPELRNIKYGKIPRGRVIYNVNMQKYFVYTDKKLLKSTIAIQTSEFFELDFDVIIRKKDRHYKTLTLQPN